MEKHQIQTLLHQVNSLNTRYSKISELTGENFNIFRILKLEASEVKLHSAFLAELLNSKGSHGQKDLFLKLFVRLFEFKKNNFDTANSYIEVEKHSGFISEDGMEGGRIDIIITDKHQNQIIIENKIYANDGFKQLFRYKQHSPKADLFYLSLDGQSPTINSTVTLIVDDDYKCISYKNDIVNWLEECRKQVVTSPILRESITIYLNLIKYLTNQTINDSMKDELSAVVISNLEAAFTISNNLTDITNRLLDKLEEDFNELIIEFAPSGFVGSYYVNPKSKYTGFHFTHKDWDYVSIGFQFQEYFKKFVYGIVTQEDPKNSPLPDKIYKTLENISGQKQKPNDWWRICHNLEAPFDKNWNTAYEGWEAIANGSFKGIIRQKAMEMIRLTNKLEL